ncbi:uncharacterized protein LOC117633542 [Prunus dulcis]|uniref:uncharacterized protein LOC117633542 n=1 Tax=Prunus dulcis TaxID=3755 RepID=UPI00148351FF|nr:uncharacterized protein LOC117633542 [Prunus dulcis]
MERMENQGLKFHHFSHEHPLEHTNSPPKQNKTCAGCNLMILPGKDYYSCPTCSFFLHQVCYNMPPKTRHPAHPSHYLNLHPSPPSSTKGPLNCQACGNHVTGFYYDCADCGLYFHGLCSGLPICIAIPSHPHALKLSFSPPFDLCCDLCNEPGSDGWLYRCLICEFDTHISCAISNQTGLQPPQNGTPLLSTSTFSRQTKHSSASSFGISVAENYNIEGNELLQLVRQKVSRGNFKSIGWDERLYSPKENFNVRVSKLGHGGPDQTDAGMAITSSNPKDPATPISEDMTLTPSYQFSEACFSIDLAKSYSSYGQNIQAKKESDQQGPKGTSDVRGTFSYSDSTTVPNKISSNSKPAKQPSFVSGPGTNYSNKIGPESRLNEAFLIEGDTLKRKEFGPKEKRKAGETMVRSAVGNQSAKSETEISSPSCWQSLFGCCNPVYERSTNLSF